MNSSLASVIVPLRNSGKHANNLLLPLVNQDYPDMEVILVVGWEDPTLPSVNQEFFDWGGIKPGALFEEIDPQALGVSKNVERLRILRGSRLVIAEVYLKDQKEWRGRNANVLRNVGARLARGDIFYFTDGKITRDKNWVSQGRELMIENQVESVAGIMVAPSGVTPNFWTRFTDNALVKRNPTFGQGRLIDKKNFGKTQSLPITATFAMTREAYFKMIDPNTGEVGFPEDFRDSYEDYAGAWLLVVNGVTIYATNDWVVYHVHRTGFKATRLEYARSARGAAQLYHTYPDCPFGQKRAQHVRIILLGMLVGIVSLASLVAFGAWTVIGVGLALGVVAYTTLGVLNAVIARHWQGFLFPALTIIYICWFSIHFVLKLIEGGGVTKTNRFLQTMWWVLRNISVGVHK